MTRVKTNIYRTVRDYIQVLKPGPSLLLTFVGVCSAIIAGGGRPPLNLLLVIGVTVLVASAGANSITNYLDRNIDARMKRTRHRVLAAGRIKPPQKVLPLVIGLIVAGLVLAWRLHPLAFAADLVGTLASVLWRKRATCVFPQGMLASWSPVLMGWFAVKPSFSWELVLLCLLIGFWLPLHVWSVMVAHREDYLQAGLKYFPMSREVKEAVKVFLLFSLVLYFTSLALNFVGGFGWLYLVFANVLGFLIVYGAVRVVVSSKPQDVWRLYKLSSYPYLGLLFVVMVLDIWLI
jgi:protoheme IX farnesyltransferase